MIAAAHAGLTMTESPILRATAGCKGSLEHPLQWIVCVLQERLSETHPLVNEAITDYARAMNKITFDHAVKTRSSGVSGLAMVPLDSSTHQKSEARQVFSASLMLFLVLMVTHCKSKLQLCTGSGACQLQECVPARLATAGAMNSEPCKCSMRLRLSCPWLWTYHHCVPTLWGRPVQKLLLQVPHCASVAVPAYSFPEKFSGFSFLSLLTKAEVIAALVKVRAECNKVKSPLVISVRVSTCTACKERLLCSLHRSNITISAEGQQSKPVSATQAHILACRAR